jgi:hypothetical protein
MKVSSSAITAILTILFMSALEDIAEVLISSGAPETINLGTGKSLFHCTNLLPF